MIYNLVYFWLCTGQQSFKDRHRNCFRSGGYKYCVQLSSLLIYNRKQKNDDAPDPQGVFVKSLPRKGFFFFAFFVFSFFFLSFYFSFSSFSLFVFLFLSFYFLFLFSFTLFLFLLFLFLFLLILVFIFVPQNVSSICALNLIKFIPKK